MANEDDGLSSEDLLRQARESFDLPDVSPPPTAASAEALGSEALLPPAGSGSSGSDGLLSESPAVPQSPPRPTYVSPPAAPPPMASPPVAPPPVAPPPVAPPPASRPMAPPPGDPVASGMRPPQPPPGLQQAAPPRAPQQHPQYKPASRWSKIPWGPVIAAVVVGIFLLIGFFAGRGTTSADDLSVGDCFEDPGLGDFSKVTDQDCALPHDIQIVATVPANLFSSTLPNLDGTETRIGGPTCEDKFFEILVESDIINDPAVVVPDDAVLGEIGETGVGGINGKTFCFIESPSGALEGSLVP